NHRVDKSTIKSVLHSFINVFANQYLGAVLFVESFQSSGEVHDVAQRRVIHPLGRAQIADHGLPDVNPKSGVKLWYFLYFKLSIDRLVGRFGLQRGAARAFAMIALRVGCVPEGHDGITDKLIDRTSL